MKYLILGNLGQWAACVLFGVGITFMVMHTWDAADTMITAGALVFSAFTKIKLIAYELDAARTRKRGQK